jgi:hypothetical protein
MRALAVVASVALLSGCLWRGHGRVLQVHLEVLASMAAKMCTLSAGPPPASQAMGEFVYPARRARVAQQRLAGDPGRASYAGFARVLQSYEALLQLFDRARVSADTWSVAAPQVCEQSRAIAAEAAAVRRQLRDEEG